uniref:Uncharacterized protein n=1 Tax=Chrysotila carterae TaxID=13221 RepID=A0A7S4B5A9_CHRCT
MYKESRHGPGMLPIIHGMCTSWWFAKTLLNLVQGVVGAFAITRSLSALQVSSTCSALPLSCGPPFGYFDYAMILQLAVLAVESAVAFGGAAFAIESLFERGWLKRLATKMPVE